MKNATILKAPIDRFEPHKLLSGVPLFPPEGTDYQSIVDSIREHGIQDPLKCVKGPKERLLILDGLHRHAIAGEVGIHELPYVLVAPDEVITTVSAALKRVKWGKGALAYRMWPFFEGITCKKGGLRGNQHKKLPNGTEFRLATAKDISKKLGMSDKLVLQAKKVHEIFDRKPALRKQFETSILLGNTTLKNLIDFAENGKVPPVSAVVSIESRLNKLPKCFANWSKLSKDDRGRAVNAFTNTVKGLPREVREATFEVLEVMRGDEATG